MNEETSKQVETDETEATVAEAVNAAEEAVGALFTVGRLWASHGLNVARLALETSAKTLEATAEALGDASERIGHEQPE